MSYSFSNGVQTQRNQRPRSAQHPVAPCTHPSLKPHHERLDRDAMHLLLDQIERALHHFSSASDVLAQGRAAPHVAPLQPSARQAEAAMHRLQDLSDVRSPAMVNLSQSLTVLVLVADMLADEDATDSDVQGIHDLLARNVQQSQTSLTQLRSVNFRSE